MIGTPDNKDLRSFISNTDIGFCIPSFQRWYIWEQEQWSILYDDLVEKYNIFKSDKDRGTHFLGFLVTYKEEDEKSDLAFHIVIDGQQRIVTLFILMAALAAIESKVVKEENDRTDIRTNITSVKSSKSLTSKISIHSHNDVLQAILKGEFDTKSRKDSLPADRKSVPYRLISCFYFFKRKIERYIKEYKEDNDFFPTFYSFLKKKIEFIVTTAENKSSATELFQLLNDNSVNLEQSDLFKNQIFYRIDDELIGPEKDKIHHKFEQLFEKIEQYVGLDDFFYRMALCKFKHFGKRKLNQKLNMIFDADKKKLKGDLDKIEFYSSIFMQMQTSEETLLDKKYFDIFREVEHLIPIMKTLYSTNYQEMKTIFFHNLSQAIEHEMKPAQIKKIIELTICFSFVDYFSDERGRSRNYSLFSKLATSFLEDKQEDVESKFFDLFSTWKDKIQPDDKDIIVDLRNINYMYGENHQKDGKFKHLVRFLLNRFYGVGRNQHFINATIEHILPISTTDVSGDVLKKFGNLTVLEKDELGNKIFSEKLATYKGVNYLQKYEQELILSKTTWGEKEINERTEYFEENLAGFLLEFDQNYFN